MKKKLKIIIPVVLILIVAIFAILYFFTDLFKSPKTLFFKYMGKAFETEEKYTYDNYLEDLKYYYEKANTSELEITMDANLEDAEEGLEELSKFKLALLSQVGPRQEESYSKMTAYYDNEALTSVEILNSNNNYGLKCADVYKDYFYFENKNLPALFEKLGIDATGIPDSIEKINVYDLLYIDKDLRESIIDRYSDIINDELDKDNFSSEKNVSVKVNGEKLKVDTYTLTLDAEDCCNLLIALVETLKDDDELLDLFIEKFDMVYGDYEELEISKEDIQYELEELLEDLEDSMDSAKEASGKIKLVVCEKNGKTVKVMLKSGETVIALDITKDKKGGEICLYAEEYDEIAFKITNKYEISKNTTKGTLTMTVEEEDLMTIDYTYESSDEKIALLATLSILDSEDYYDDSEPTTIGIDFKYECTGKNLDDKPTDVKYNGYVKLIEDMEDDDSQYVSINFTGSSKYTDSVDIPSLNSGVCINTITEEEFEAIKPEINTNVNAFIDKVLPKFDLTREDVGLTAEPIDIFEQFNQTTNTYEDDLIIDTDFDYTSQLESLSL